jgi:hypothetical protein
MPIGGIIRIVVPQVAIAPSMEAAPPHDRGRTIIGALGAFLSFKGYLRRA